MSNNNVIIREIKRKDNAQIEQVIRNCFPEYKIPLEGTAYADPETKNMFDGYKNNNDVYYIIAVAGEILGGVGVKPLKNVEDGTCEIQKMYFSPKIRGQGYGKIMFEKCLSSAKKMGYKKCYLESAPQLKAAIHIYENFGFKHLTEPLGETGHTACGVWMIKEL